MKKYLLVIFLLCIMLVSGCEGEEIVENYFEENMILVESGTTSEENGDLSLEYDIYMGKYPVTFDEYIEYCEDVDKEIPDDMDWGRGNRPVINVSWYDAAAYLNWLSEREGFEPAYVENDEGNYELADEPENVEGYRLPLAFEWEYAARGGAEGEATEFAGSDDPEEVAWFNANAEGMTQPVGEKRPNELGIYDMSGNVWEFTNCSARHGAVRIRRGGAWNYNHSRCRVSHWQFSYPSYFHSSLGFRVAKTK